MDDRTEEVAQVCTHEPNSSKELSFTNLMVGIMDGYKIYISIRNIQTMG